MYELNTVNDKERLNACTLHLCIYNINQSYIVIELY